jgi:hypothetical protein
MFKHTVLATALAVALCLPLRAISAEDPTLAQIRAEIQQIKESYEARIQSLEKRLQESEAKASNTTPVAIASNPAPIPNNRTASNALNPDVSLILGGSYSRLSQDPGKYRLQGFIPGGDEIGPGKRSFNLGESELTLSANIDPNFSGKLTFSLSADNQISVEEAYFQSQGLSNGINIRGGRFLSSVGYLNSQHAHAWDFVDAPLVYQAMFGGQYKPDGLQLKWLAPTETFVELGVEAGNGSVSPGNDRNKNGVGSFAAFAHIGDDIGESASWRAGLSYLQTGATGRAYNDPINSAENLFDGTSKVWIVDGIYKWAPNGNATNTNLKLQGEYFHRQENGTLTQGTDALGFSSRQSGGYLQAVYQFMPAWRVGLRYDRLNSGMPNLDFGSSSLTTADFPLLAKYRPTRSSLMFDYSPSEFSRFRLQFAQDKSRPEVTDNQIFLQYIMSLGVHGAHSF